MRAERRGSFWPARPDYKKQREETNMELEPKLRNIYFSKIDCAFSIASRVRIFSLSCARNQARSATGRRPLANSSSVNTSVTQVSFSAPLKILLQSCRRPDRAGWCIFVFWDQCFL